MRIKKTILQHYIEIEQKFWPLTSKSTNLPRLPHLIFSMLRHTHLDCVTLEHSPPCTYQTLAGSLWRDRVQSTRSSSALRREEGRLNAPENQEAGGGFCLQPWVRQKETPLEALLTCGFVYVFSVCLNQNTKTERHSFSWADELPHSLFSASLRKIHNFCLIKKKYWYRAF